MQDNITALNIEEGYKNNKTTKVVPGKHAKPAKLSSGQTFRTKTAAIMEKVNVPAPVETPAPQAAVAPPVPEPANVAVSTPEVAPAAPVPSQTAPVAEETDLPTDDVVLSKITKLNTTYVEPNNAKSNGTRRLKISSPVATRTGNTFKVMAKNAPVVETPAPETSAVAPETPALGEATPAPVPEVPVPTTPSPEVTETATPDTMMAPDSGFFLGQKLNTETNENGETEVTPTADTETEEVTEEAEETTSEITQEEKDERLNQILNSNQGNIVDFSAAKKALEELANRRNAINQLNKEMEEARRIRESQNQELQQLLADAPKMLDDLDREKMSRTEELSNLRAEIIQYDDLIKQNRGFQGNQEEYEEEMSYGRSRG